MATSATIGLLRVLLTANTAEFQAAMKQASDTAKTWSKDLKTIGQQATAIGATLTKLLTVPILGVAAGALKAATDFEDSFAGIRKTVGDATDSMGKLTPVGEALAQGMRNLAKEIPVNVNELNRIGEAAGQLGIKSGNIIAFTEVMAKLGVTTNLSSDQAATSLARFANIMDATKVAAGTFEFDRLGATIVGLGNRFETTEAEIVDFALRIASAGKLAGLAEHEVLAIGTAMSSVGVQAEAGGTAVQKVLNDMTAAVAKGGDSLEVFASTAGMTAQQFADLYRRDAAGAFQAFVEGLGQQGDKAFGTLDALGLGNERVIRAFLSLAVAGDKLGNTFKQGEKDWEENIALTKEAEQRFNTFTNQVALTWAWVRDLGITIGDALLPTLRDLMVVVQPLIVAAGSLAKWFAELPQPIRVVGIALLGVVAAAGPAVFVLGQLALAGSALIGAFQVGGILVGATVAIRGVGVAALAAAPQLAAFTIAAASVVAIGSALRNAYGLYTDKAEQARLETEQNKSHLLALAAASKVAGRAITDVAQANDILRANAIKLQAAHTAQARAQDDATKALRASAPAAQTLSSMLAATRSEVTNLTKAQREQLIAGDKMGLSTKELQDAFNKLFPEVKLSEGAIELYKKQVEAGKKSSDEAKKAIDEFRGSIKSLVSVTTTWVDMGRGVQVAFSQLAPTVRSAAEAIRDLGGSLRDLPSDTSFVDDMWVPFRAAVRESRTEVISLGDSIRTNIGDVLDGLPQLLQSAFTGGGGLAGAFKALGVQLADAIMTPLIATWTKFQKLASGVGSSIAAGVGGAVGGSTLATVAGLAGALGGAALMGTAVGAALTTAVGATAALGIATAGVGLAVVGVWAAYKKWFTVSKEVKQARADLLKFEDSIITTLTATQQAEAGGERWAQVLIGVRDTFLQTGRTAEEAERLVAQMFDTNNPERSREAIALVGQAYAELAEQQRIVAEGTEEANGILQDLEAQAALMGNTMPDSLRPMIDRLVEMGVVTEETAAQLGAIGNEGEVSIDAMKKAAEEFDISLDQLGPTFKQQQLTEESQRILRGINLLTAGGTDANVVLDGMQDEIQAVVLQSRKFGTEIPENMRPYLQSLVDGGELVDENGVKLTDLSSLKFGPPIADQWQIITDKLSTLIDKIDLGLRRALGDFGTKTNEVTQDAAHDFGTVIGEVNALGVAIRRLPDMPDVSLADVPSFTPVESFAHGSRGIRDFGSGALAMLHGREAVIPASDMVAAGSSGGGGIHVTVNAQGAFFDTPDSLRRLGQKVAEAIRQSGDLSRVSFGFGGAR